MVVNQYQKTFLPVSKFYTREDEVDDSKMNTMFDNIFITCSKLMNQNKKIDNAMLDMIKLEYVKDLCSKIFIMHKYNDGPYKEYALSTESFIHYIDQMIKTNQDIRVLLTMVNFKKLKFDCDTVPPSLTSSEEITILDTPNKENIPPPVVEIVDVKHEPTDHTIDSNQVEIGYYYPIQVIIDDKINTKELMKVESIRLKEKDQFFSWYINLTIHCALHSIYIPQIDCMEKDNIMR
eukprot:8798391-Ditylum_brightwellii.AAC.1